MLNRKHNVLAGSLASCGYFLAVALQLLLRLMDLFPRLLILVTAVVVGVWEKERSHGDWSAANTWLLFGEFLAQTTLSAAFVLVGIESLLIPVGAAQCSVHAMSSGSASRRPDDDTEVH